MRLIFLILIFCFVCCKKQEKRISETLIELDTCFSDTNNKRQMKIGIPEIFDVSEASKPINLSIPKGIYLDSFQISIPSKALTVEIVLPKLEDKRLIIANRHLSSMINEEKKWFIKSIDQSLSEDDWMLEAKRGNFFRVWTQEIYKSTDFVSYLLVKETYFAESSHPKAEYISFNFDLNKQKIIEFSNFFKIKNDNDKAKFIDKINSRINDKSLSVEEFYEFDFNFNERKIFINFDDYEIASYAYGLQRSEIDKNELSSFVYNYYINSKK